MSIRYIDYSIKLTESIVANHVYIPAKVKHGKTKQPIIRYNLFLRFKTNLYNLFSIHTSSQSIY